MKVFGSKHYTGFYVSPYNRYVEWVSVMLTCLCCLMLELSEKRRWHVKLTSIVFGNNINVVSLTSKGVVNDKGVRCVEKWWVDKLVFAHGKKKIYIPV